MPQIGGKAASLARLVQAGFRVPDAVVLTTTFFAGWWEELRATADWARFQQADAAACIQHAAALGARVEGLACSIEMRAGLDEVRERLASWGARATCAVRSSSPDEDLEAASFAGGYVTRLGVTAEGLEAAVRACFASCLAERVLVYKAQHGLDVHAPRIAVVVQQQLASEVAGVGFSLNPVTNDFDEAVIDANFGLGESVVSGEVSPDHFVVDKPGEKILERTLGAKAISYRLQAQGGIERLDEERGTEAALSDAQVIELSRVLGEVEALYDLPIDLEWAYADGELHLLQARPITAYFPLSPEMQTQPGAPRRLYADGNLSDGITSNRPITELTLDGYRIVMAQLFENYGIAWGSEEKPLEDLLVFRGARMYAALSDIFWFMSPQVMAAQATIMDILLYRTLINV
ncbi:MAG: PEP/pyruvate-binding domain-containing protein, partial [Myxococcota bacterium]